MAAEGHDMNDDPLTMIIANLDQLAANFVPVADTLGRCRQALIDAGFSAGTAETITARWFEHNILPPKYPIDALFRGLDR